MIPDTQFNDDTRGQLFSIEAAFSVLLVVLMLLTLTQAIAIDPFTAATQQNNVESTAAETGENVLEVAKQKGELRAALLAYDVSTDSFEGTTNGEYSGPPATELGDTLSVITDAGYNYNVVLTHQRAGGGLAYHRFIYQGEPTQNSISVTETVTLYNDDELYDGQGTLENNSADYVFPQVAGYNNIYNTVQIRVVIW